MTDQEGDTSLVDLLVGLRVVQSQQSEINRRLGLTEKRLEALAFDPRRIEMLEERYADIGEDRDQWWNWFIQAVLWVAGVTVASAIAAYFGVEVQS